MSKISQLSEQLDELCRCGEALIGVANSLREMFSGEEKYEAAVAEPAAAAEKPKSKAKAKQKPEPQPVKEEKKAARRKSDERRCKSFSKRQFRAHSL